MLNILIKIIPLDLAATLSPGILALTIFIIAGKNHPRSHAMALFLGSLLVGIGITVIGFTLGNSLDTGAKQNLTESIVDIVLGLFLLFYGLKIYISKEIRVSLTEDKHELKIFKWFGLGLIITITNFDAVFLNLTAAKEIGAADIFEINKIILLIVGLIFFTLPITLPILLKICFPKIAEPILVKINHFMTRFGRYIVFGMFLIFGLFLLYRGLNFFF